MCTVTYLPLADDNFILTSNRDEGIKRKPALLPDLYSIDGKAIIFPKDSEAGGTWIGMTPSRVVCLMNGAFDRHTRKPPYRMSRGQIVLNALTTSDIEDFLSQYDLQNIEPFTLVAFDFKNQLQRWELRWDAEYRHLKTLPHEAQIWSSATLYTSSMHALRQKWFEAWRSQNPNYEVDKIRKFHQTAGEGDPITDLRTERGYLRTISITSIEKTSQNIEMNYEDLRNFASKTTSFSLDHE